MAMTNYLTFSLSILMRTVRPVVAAASLWQLFAKRANFAVSLKVSHR